MRRGNLGKISIIYIIIAAIFAVISFSLDQMVIQTEDKMRKKNAMYNFLKETLDSILQFLFPN